MFTQLAERNGPLAFLLLFMCSKPGMMYSGVLTYGCLVENDVVGHQVTTQRRKKTIECSKSILMVRANYAYAAERKTILYPPPWGIMITKSNK